MPATIESAATEIDELPTHVFVSPSQIRLDEINEQDYLWDEDFGYVPQFRWVYYSVGSGVFNWIETKGRINELERLEEESYQKRLRPNGMLTDLMEMPLAQIIKYFNIPREVLEKHNAELWQIWVEWGVDLSIPTEEYELPNPDIVYTFDNEIINAYYRRENPVAPEPGTYTTYGSYEEYLKAKP